MIRATVARGLKAAIGSSENHLNALSQDTQRSAAECGQVNAVEI